MKKLNGLDWLALVLVVVGALNWGLVGIFGFDLVNWLFVESINLAILARIVYILVGLAGIYLLVSMLGKENTQM